MLKNVYEGLNARPKVYLSKEYFCKMYPTCVSSKLCEFISSEIVKYSKRKVVYKKLWFSHNTRSFIDNLYRDLGWLQTPLLRSSLQRFFQAANIGQACEHTHGWKTLQVICQKKLSEIEKLLYTIRWDFLLWFSMFLIFLQHFSCAHLKVRKGVGLWTIFWAVIPDGHNCVEAKIAQL